MWFIRLCTSNYEHDGAQTVWSYRIAVNCTNMPNSFSSYATAAINEIEAKNPPLLQYQKRQKPEALL